MGPRPLDLLVFHGDLEMFPASGYPQIIHLGKIFHEINHPFLGTPILGNLHICHDVLYC